MVVSTVILTSIMSPGSASSVSDKGLTETAAAAHNCVYYELQS